MPRRAGEQHADIQIRVHRRTAAQLRPRYEVRSAGYSRGRPPEQPWERCPPSPGLKRTDDATDSAHALL